MFRTVFAGEGSGLSLAEGVRKADLTADGVCEFLDAWLGLLERLVSPRQLLDSPHNTARLSADSSQLQPFNAQQFMAYIHKVSDSSLPLDQWSSQSLHCPGVDGVSLEFVLGCSSPRCLSVCVCV